jgi:hypothetical protein
VLTGKDIWERDPPIGTHVKGAARDRVVTADQVVSREPDLIIGSWCGKKFRAKRVASALRNSRLCNIKTC